MDSGLAIGHRRLRRARPARERWSPLTALVAWWSQARFDRDLAAGAEPSTDARLGYRARRLGGARMRRRIAASLRCVIEEAENGSHGPSSEAPVQRRFVLAARPALRDLIERLDADGPVRPRGVAMSLVLLTDASGPLYRGDDPQALPRAALAAASALQDGW